MFGSEQSHQIGHAGRVLRFCRNFRSRRPQPALHQLNQTSHRPAMHCPEGQTNAGRNSFPARDKKMRPWALCRADRFSQPGVETDRAPAITKRCART